MNIVASRFAYCKIRAKIVRTSHKIRAQCKVRYVIHTLEVEPKAGDNLPAICAALKKFVFGAVERCPFFVADKRPFLNRARGKRGFRFGRCYTP